MSRKFAGTTALVLATATAIGALAGCGSSSSSKVGAAPSTTAAGSPASTAGGTLAATAGTSSPLVIGSFASLTSPTYTSPDSRAGLTAGVDAVNAAGGIDGHRLKLEFCDTQYTASGELSCAQQLISDHVIAAIAPQVLADTSGQEYKLFTAAKIPVIGTEGLLPSEFTSPVVFPLSSGVPGWIYGDVAILVAAGDKKISVIGDADPASLYAEALVKAALAEAKLTPTAIVTANPQGDPTLSSAAAEATVGGTDGVIVVCAPQNIPKALSALKAGGYTGKVAGLSADFVPPIIRALGSLGNGLLLSSLDAFASDTANSAAVTYRADLARFEPKAGVDDQSFAPWAALQLFLAVAGPARATTATGVLSAFTNLSKPVTTGGIAPYAVKGQVSPIASDPRMFNPTVEAGSIENGKIVASGKGFFNPFTQLASS